MSSLPVSPQPLRDPAADLARRHQALGSPYTLTSNDLLQRQSERESNARSYPRRIPLALRRAAGVYVEDVDGRVFIDCLAGAGTLALGHNHPVVREAIQQALDDGLPLHTLDLTTPVKDRYVQALFDSLPAEFARDAKIQFCGPTGADAIEAALKLVRISTGRSTALAFHGAYHGMTQGALNLMGNLGPKAALHGTLNNVQFMPYPYDYRCPFGLGGDAGAQAGLHYLRTVLKDPESGVPAPAAIVTELVQGEGGVVCAPDAWTRGLRHLASETGTPLLVDEVQTGLGRTGKLYAFEHAGILPDVLVLSKAIGGGLPMSVVIYRGDFDQWRPGSHAGTFRGNQLAMAAGTATLRHIEQEGLAARAAELGRHLHGRLEQLQGRHACIGDVRGRGLMVGVELIDPQAGSDTLGYPIAASALASAVQAACLRRGLILELGGRHGSVLRLLPPLIITAAELDRVCEILDLALIEAIRPLAAAA